jgi:hypothetical protein
VVAVLRDERNCTLEATVRMNPSASGRERAEQQLRDLRDWLHAEPALREA